MECAREHCLTAPTWQAGSVFVQCAMWRVAVSCMPPLRHSSKTDPVVQGQQRTSRKQLNSSDDLKVGVCIKVILLPSSIGFSGRLPSLFLSLPIASRSRRLPICLSTACTRHALKLTHTLPASSAMRSSTDTSHAPHCLSSPALIWVASPRTREDSSPGQTRTTTTRQSIVK